MIKRKILFVDDNKDYVEELSKELKTQYDLTVAYDVNDFWKKYSPYKYDLIIFDIKLSKGKDEGLDLLKKVKEKNPLQSTIVLTNYAEKEYFARAMENGAILFLDKSEFSPKTIVKLVNSIIEQSKLRKRVDFLENRLRTIEQFQLIGNSEAMRKVKESILFAAEDGEITVLIKGESGTGKELVAKNIHMTGIRKKGPFVAVSISGLHKDTIYSELFGHERGAFTGAITSRRGFIEEAHEGVLFLDEIGDLDMETQIKLLRVIETKSFTKLGSNEEIHVDVQFLTATNKDIETLINEGKFREDLYYRLKAFEIYIPPLRDRKEDIEELATYFLRNMEKLGRTTAKSIDKKVLNRFLSYSWPGNVRELRNVVEYAAIKARFQNADVIELSHLPEDFNSLKKSDNLKFSEKKDFKFNLAISELELLDKTIKETGIRKKTKLAQILNYKNRFTFLRRIKRIFYSYPELKNKYKNIATMFLRDSGDGE